MQRYLELGSVEAIVRELSNSQATSSDATNASTAITVLLARENVAPPIPPILVFWRDLLRVLRETAVATTTLVALPVALVAIIISVTQRIRRGDRSRPDLPWRGHGRRHRDHHR